MGAGWLVAGASEQELKAGFVASMSAAISRLSLKRPELREQLQTLNARTASLYGEYRYGQLLERLFLIGKDISNRLSEDDGGPDKQVRKMIELIHRNSSDSLKLEALAEALGYSSSYLGKLFKSATGENFNTYLDKVRIGKAKELLRQGKKVYEVAERVGYTNVDYFHAKFRKYVGSSPISFRKKGEGEDTTE
jgi:two-component system response regulator YesN